MDTDELVQCPYNQSHSILSSRMQCHLMKCRQQYPGLEKKTCPYNSIHVVNKVELEYHCETCPDRILVDCYNYVMGPDREVAKPLISKIKPLAISGEELWDDDTPTNVLETVQESCKSRWALQTMVGLSKSERKEFKKQQRLKATYFSNNPDSRTNEYDQPGSSGVGVEQTYMREEAEQKDNTDVDNRGKTYSSDSDQSVSDQQPIQTTTANGSEAKETVRRDLKNPWGTSNPTVLNNEDKAQRNEDVSESAGSISSQQAGPVRKMVRDPSNPWGSPLITPITSVLGDNNQFPGLAVTARRQNGKKAANKRNQRLY